MSLDLQKYGISDSDLSEARALLEQMRFIGEDSGPNWDALLDGNFSEAGDNFKIEDRVNRLLKNVVMGRQVAPSQNWDVAEKVIRQLDKGNNEALDDKLHPERIWPARIPVDVEETDPQMQWLGSENIRAIKTNLNNAVKEPREFLNKLPGLVEFLRRKGYELEAVIEIINIAISFFKGRQGTPNILDITFLEIPRLAKDFNLKKYSSVQIVSLLKILFNESVYRTPKMDQIDKVLKYFDSDRYPADEVVRFLTLFFLIAAKNSFDAYISYIPPMMDAFDKEKYTGSQALEISTLLLRLYDPHILELLVKTTTGGPMSEVIKPFEKNHYPPELVITILRKICELDLELFSHNNPFQLLPKAMKKLGDRNRFPSDEFLLMRLEAELKVEAMKWSKSQKVKDFDLDFIGSQSLRLGALAVHGYEVKAKKSSGDSVPYSQATQLKKLVVGALILSNEPELAEIVANSPVNEKVVEAAIQFRSGNIEEEAFDAYVRGAYQLDEIPSRDEEIKTRISHLSHLTAGSTPISIPHAVRAAPVAMFMR